MSTEKKISADIRIFAGSWPADTRIQNFTIRPGLVHTLWNYTRQLNIWIHWLPLSVIFVILHLSIKQTWKRHKKTCSLDSTSPAKDPSAKCSTTRSFTTKNPTCHVCGKSFSRKDSLIRHIIRVHENTTYACQYCNKSFTRNTHHKCTGTNNTVHVDPHVTTPLSDKEKKQKSRILSQLEDTGLQPKNQRTPTELQPNNLKLPRVLQICHAPETF